MLPSGSRLFVRTSKSCLHLVQLFLVFGAEVERAERDVDSLDCSSEWEWRLIGIGHRRTGVGAHAEGVDSKAACHRVLNPHTAGFLAVDPDDGLTTLTQSAPIVGKLHRDRGLALGERNV